MYVPNGSMELVYAAFAVLALFIASGLAATLHRKRAVAFSIGLPLLVIDTALFISLFVSKVSASFLGIFEVYPFSTLFASLFMASGAVIYLVSYKYSNDFGNFSALFGFVMLGAIGVSASTSLVTTVVGIELVSLSTVFMILLDGKSRVEPAVKLFILGAIAISVLLFAVSLIFSYDPSLLLSGFAANGYISGSYVITLAIVLFISGFSFEASLFPFNLWVPDVYQGAPTYVTAMLAGVNKKVAFVAIMTTFFILLSKYLAVFSLIFELLAIFTMFFGNIMAFVQKDVKRLFAYSSISQAGYILIGIAVADSFGIEASIVQIAAHMFMIIGAFSIVLWLESKGLKSIDDYSGLGYRNLFAGIALSIFMLSMAGVPPLLGFTSKLLLFSSAVDKGMLVLASFGVLNSFMSIYYYGKLLGSMYSKKSGDRLFMNGYIIAAVIVCLAVIIAFGLYPGPIINAANIASLSLFGI
ncbi:MAG: NADH-quinone oxidoreductase subunit N [Candidatus Micrarchaeaceae archaeon]